MEMTHIEKFMKLLPHDEFITSHEVTITNNNLALFTVRGPSSPCTIIPGAPILRVEWNLKTHLAVEVKIAFQNDPLIKRSLKAEESFLNIDKTVTIKANFNLPSPEAINCLYNEAFCQCFDKQLEEALSN